MEHCKADASSYFSGVRTDPIDIPWSDNRQEQHSLNFFVKNSAPQLAGYFDSPFWQRTVLQAARNEPAVRYAVAGIGALHEKLLTGSVSPEQSQDQRTRFALEQCNKSIHALLKTPVSSGPYWLCWKLRVHTLPTVAARLCAHDPATLIYKLEVARSISC